MNDYVMSCRDCGGTRFQQQPDQQWACAACGSHTVRFAVDPARLVVNSAESRGAR